MLNWIPRSEPYWLFWILSAELLMAIIGTIFSVLIWRMAKIEFEYDKEWNERKAARRKRAMQFEHLTEGEGK